TGVVMFATQGHLPFWMAIWGAVIFVQVLRTTPMAWSLFVRRRVGDRAAPPAVPPSETWALPGGVAAGPPSTVAQEAARVRTLLERGGGSDTPRLLAEVDGILKLVGELAAREADLEEQTSDSERAQLAAATAAAQARLEHATLAQDRRLFERQLEVV